VLRQALRAIHQELAEARQDFPDWRRCAQRQHTVRLAAAHLLRRQLQLAQQVALIRQGHIPQMNGHPATLGGAGGALSTHTWGPERNFGGPAHPFARLLHSLSTATGGALRTEATFVSPFLPSFVRMGFALRRAQDRALRLIAGLFPVSLTVPPADGRGTYTIYLAAPTIASQLATQAANAGSPAYGVPEGLQPHRPPITASGGGATGNGGGSGSSGPGSPGTAVTSGGGTQAEAPSIGDDEDIATLCGFIAHLVVLMAAVLRVPLRYPLSLGASRSGIRDPLGAYGSPATASAALATAANPHSASGGGGAGASGGGGSGAAGDSTFLPLYAKGVERGRFFQGLALLCQDVNQLLAARDMFPLDATALVTNLYLLQRAATASCVGPNPDHDLLDEQLQPLMPNLVTPPGGAGGTGGASAGLGTAAMAGSPAEAAILQSVITGTPVAQMTPHMAQAARARPPDAFAAPHHHHVATHPFAVQLENPFLGRVCRDIETERVMLWQGVLASAVAIAPPPGVGTTTTTAGFAGITGGAGGTLTKARTGVAGAGASSSTDTRQYSKSMLAGGGLARPLASSDSAAASPPSGDGGGRILRGQAGDRHSLLRPEPPPPVPTPAEMRVAEVDPLADDSSPR